MSTRVLLIGQEPTTVDLQNPNLPPGLSVAAISESLDIGLCRLLERDWVAELLLVRPDEDADLAIRDWLLSHADYDCIVIVIGAGVRLPTVNLVFFETVVNAVHHAAPHAKIGFNTRPQDTVEVVERLMGE